MPSLTYAGMWLTFSIEDLAPWKWDLWTEFCGVSLPPWAPEDLIAAQGGKVQHFPTEHLPAARTFWANFKSMEAGERLVYMQKRSDNDSAGRTAIVTWVDWMMGQCKFHKEVTRIIEDLRCHPRQHMKQLRWGPDKVSTPTYRSWPSMEISDNHHPSFHSYRTPTSRSPIVLW